MNYIKHVLAASITIALTACGGGGGSAPVSNTSTTTPTTTTPAPTTTTPAPTTTTPAPTTTTPAPTTTNKYAYFSGNGQILQYALLTNGAVSTTSLPPVSAGQKRSINFTIAPSGKYAYAADDSSTSPAIYQYTIGADGALQPMATPSLALKSLSKIVISPDGKYLFALGRVSFVGGGMVQYAIDGNGALSLVGEFTIQSSVSGDVKFMRFDTSGQHLYIASNGGLSVYNMGANYVPVPTPANTYTFSANTTTNSLIVDPKGKYASVINCTAGYSNICTAISYGAKTSYFQLPAGSLMAMDNTGTYAYVVSESTTSSGSFVITPYLVGSDGSFSKPYFGNPLPLTAGRADSIVIDPTNNNIYVGASSSATGVVTQFTTDQYAILTQASMSAGISASTDPLFQSPLLAIH